MADLEDAAADDMRRHRPDALGDDGLLAGRHIRLAPAIGAVLGLDPAEQQILRALGAEDKALDARDFHRMPLSLRSGSAEFPARPYNPNRIPGESRDPPGRI